MSNGYVIYEESGDRWSVTPPLSSGKSLIKSFLQLTPMDFKEYIRSEKNALYQKGTCRLFMTAYWKSRNW